jgi:hypothetical protein
MNPYLKGALKPAWSDPEARAILHQRKMQRDNEWLLRQIGTPTYLLSLEILGYLPNEAKTELNLLKMERT